MPERNIIEASLVNYDPESKLYQLKADGTGEDINTHFTARYKDALSSHASGAQSIATDGFSKFGITYKVDITDRENPIIVGSVPRSESQHLNTEQVYPVTTPGLSGLITRPFSNVLGRLLNKGFKSRGDASLVGPHNCGSTSMWGSTYGHTLGHAFIKASPMASVEAFVYDDTLRMKGYNSYMWTALGERNIVNTADTTTEGVQETHLVHEALGRNKKETQFSIDSGFATGPGTIDDSLLKHTKARYEDLVTEAENDTEEGAESRLLVKKIQQRYEQYQKDKPQILPRRVRLNGYLGHGDLDLIVKSTAVPYKIPDNESNADCTGVIGGKKDGSDIDTDSFNQTYVESQHSKKHVPASTTMSEIHRTIDGRVRIASAKSISLVKDIAVPVPQRTNIDIDTTNSDFDVKQKEELELENPQDATSLVDRKDSYDQKHDQEFINNHPEWDYEEDTGSMISRVLDGSEYEPEHLSKHEHPVPSHVLLEIDESTNSRYYKGKAGIYVTEDGGVVIRDAYGSSIRMTGGNIYMDCPGDIVEMPGRDKVVLAGRNLSMQSKYDAELVSNDGNTRVAADKQMEIMGGSAGSGGVLIENKAEGEPSESEGKDISTAGLVIKSKSYTSVECKKIGVVGENMSIKGNLSVSGLMTAKDVHADNLQANAGNFEGLSRTATWSSRGGGTGGPFSTGQNVTPVSDIETSVGERGFKAPNFKFSFNSSEEYGLMLSDYKFELIEPIWQSNERNTTGEQGDDWELPPSSMTDSPDFSYPYPGYSLWTTPTLKQLKEYSVGDSWEETTNPYSDAFDKVNLLKLKVNKEQ